jgi:hypothetical protein
VKKVAGQDRVGLGQGHEVKDLSRLSTRARLRVSAV